MKMQNTFKRAGGLLSALMAAVFSSSADAGLKYWTTGNYDADSYVQEGLVLNYDGIRNVGIDQPHSTTTTTWVNLGSGGSANNARAYSRNTNNTSTSWTADSIANGSWTDYGFFFNQRSRWDIPGSFTLDQFTVQLVTDITRANAQSSDGRMYAVFGGPSGGSEWKTLGVATLKNTGYGNGMYFPLDNWGYSKRPSIPDTTVKYFTGAQDATSAYAISGTDLSSATTANYGLISGRTATGSKTISGVILGSNGTGSQALTGTIKSFRLYPSRVLSADELAWNRAVDDYRFFGIPVSTIPVTNAVIASSIACVGGNEAAGVYAVDASGYTFTAPASKTVNGRAYTCTGYTRETWDDATGDWGEPVLQSGTSVTVASTDRVRITWQWTEGDGIVTRYTTADYVQEGLLLQYDGIRNVGADMPHSSDTTAWKNLAPAGGWDMVFHAKSGVTKPGEWRADGYRFEQQSWFTPGTAFTLPSNQTVQIAVEANGLDQEDYLNENSARVNEPYLWYNTGTFNKGGSISLRRDNRDTGNEWFDWSTHGYSTATGNAATRPAPCQPNGTPLRYVTTILADNYTAAFIGTSIPTTASANRFVTGAVRMALTSTPQVQTASGNGFYIGGLADNTLRKYRGTIHNFRFYNRVLTNEELAHNRVVDDYRFHGVIPVTNVIVATSHSFFAGNEANGNYEISGAYTFSAPTETQTDAHGIKYTLDGYTLETWNSETLGWSTPVANTGSSYTYTVGASPAKVRLTWRWKATEGLRTAADYGPEDVVPNGLVLHYDGIKNIGVESDDVTNPTSAWAKAWANLADPGAYTLLRQDKETRAGCWTDCGYAFTNTTGSVGGYFKYAGNFTFNPHYSLQVLVDAKVEDQYNSLCGYLMYCNPWKAASMAIRTSTDYNYAMYYVADDAYGADARPKIANASKTYSYATAIVNGKTSTFFEGTKAPTSGSAAQGYYYNANTSAMATNVTAISIGGGSGNQDFTGIVKSIRYYDRVLTNEELVHNRNVDSARYFGALATTNVFVTTKFAAGGEQAESGAYKVEGSWDFTATTVLDRNDAVVPVAGYYTETFVDGEWTDRKWHSGQKYSYVEGTDPAYVRLTWGPLPDGTMLLVR